jgi:Questin oxidase-like
LRRRAKEEDLVTSDVLDEAYARLHRWGPEWGGGNGLSNHGPMAVEVLTRRGYDDQVDSWLDRYVARLEVLPGEGDPITEDNWAEAMGQRRRVGDWVAFFRRAVREAAWPGVLAAWWPRLLPAIASGATHGLIRTGHAVRTVLGGDTSPSAVDEIAHGLAYWAARAIYVPGLAAPVGHLEAEAALAGLPRLAEQRGEIRERFARLGDLAAWTPALTTLRAPGTAEEIPAALASLVEAGARQYTTHGHGSPVLLVHVATAPNAMRHLLPALPTELWPPSFAATWAACAAITVAYAPAQPLEAQRSTAESAIEPDELMALAAQHGDEHVIKLTDTVLDAYARSGDPSFLSAATHCADLIDRPQ